MTKKEAKKHYMKIKNSALDEIALNVIDDIYYDFKSRTCENCKYMQESTQLIDYKCSLGVKQDFDFGVKKDFGCNQFTRKDNG